MSIITKMCRELAVYWPPIAPDSHGKPRYGDPVELTVRWEDGREDVVGQEDDRDEASTRIFFLEPDASAPIVVVRGKFLYGALTSSTPVSPVGLMGAIEVKRVQRTPNFRATEFLRIAFAG